MNKVSNEKIKTNLLKTVKDINSISEQYGMNELPRAEARKIADSVVKRIKKAMYFKIRVYLPGVISAELEKEIIIDKLKKEFDVLNTSKIYKKGSHRSIYVDLKAKNLKA